MAVIALKPGSLVSWQGEDFEVVNLIDLKEVLASSLKDMRRVVIPVSQLSAPGGLRPSKDLLRIPEKDWDDARRRYAAIRPLLGLPAKGKSGKAGGATEGSPARSTIYRWRERFLESGTLESLLPQRRGVKEGSRFLSESVERLLDLAIQEDYLTKQRLAVTAFYESLQVRFRRAGFAPPHINTVRKRLAALPEKERTRRRHGSDAADQAYSAIEGSAVAEFPLAVVQVDHTPLDIILVDDEFRMPIGRPWLTLAFDVCTRMVLGFYLSLDPPGALSAGLCMLRAILPKEEWIRSLGLDVEWPCWGIPASMHMDNAKEFRGKMLAKACERYQIDPQWRPVQKPKWGGHIERYLGNVMEHLKRLPGTTFSGPEERGRYDSEGKAIFSLGEMERYLVLYFCGEYHLATHSALGMSPLEAWKEAFRGNSALPRMETDAGRLRMDFMPYEERVINREGVLIDWVHYFDDVLRPYIGSVLPGRARLRRKFVFRRDPRDLSVIYFFDEDNDVYHPIPYRNRARPPISLWELKAARRRLRERPNSDCNEDAIFAAREEMISMVATAAKETKRRRREAQRQRGHTGVHSPKARQGAAREPERGDRPEGADERSVEPFDEISL